MVLFINKKVLIRLKNQNGMRLEGKAKYPNIYI